MAECLGSITAVRLVRFKREDPSSLAVVLSLNNLEFSRYLLRECQPRDREIRRAVEYLRKELDGFANWQARFDPRKRSRLEGSPQAVKFPRGVFPYLKPDIKETGEYLEVNLPESPDVIAQFAVSLRRAEQIGPGRFRVPLAAKSVVLAWFASVRGA